MRHALSTVHEIHHFADRVFHRLFSLSRRRRRTHRAQVTLLMILKISQSHPGARLSSIRSRSLFIPIVGGIGPGGGIGFGVGYESPDDARWYREGEAMVTVRRYWALQGEIGRRSSSRRSQIGVFGGVRDMSRIDFFGIGSRTLFDDRSAFRLRESTLGLRGSHRLLPAVKLGGMLAAYLPDLGRGAQPFRAVD